MKTLILIAAIAPLPAAAAAQQKSPEDAAVRKAIADRGGEWKIIHKTFHRFPKSAAVTK